MRLLPRFALLGLACFMLQACQLVLPMFLVAGSTALELRVGFGAPSEPLTVLVDELAVYPCRSVGRGSVSGTWPNEALSVWRFEGQSSERQVQLQYGQLPAGAVLRHAPEALEVPGCYVFRVFARRASGGYQRGKLGVRLSAGGAATALSSGELEALFTPART